MALAGLSLAALDQDSTLRLLEQLDREDAESEAALLQKEAEALASKQAEIRKRLAQLNLNQTKPNGASSSHEPMNRNARPAESESSSADDDDDTAASAPDGNPTHDTLGLGIVLTEAAILQRLRRMCKRRKNGKVPGGEDAYNAYQDVDRRNDLAASLADGLQEVQTQLEDEAPATAGLAAAGPGHEAIWDVYNLCVVSFRELKTEIDVAIETSSVLAVQAVSLENKVVPTVTDLQRELKAQESEAAAKKPKAKPSTKAKAKNNKK
eukprot:s1493_g4.t1